MRIRFKHILLLVLAIFCFGNSYGQNDSYRKNLESRIKQDIHDTLRARIYIDLAEYLNKESEWLPYNQKALELANKHLKTAKGKEKLYYYQIKAHAFGNLGYYQDSHGNLSKSIAYYFESLELYDKANDQAGKAAILGNLGVIYTNRKDYEEALDYLNQALALKIKFDPIKYLKITQILGLHWKELVILLKP